MTYRKLSIIFTVFGLICLLLTFFGEQNFEYILPLNWETQLTIDPKYFRLFLIIYFLSIAGIAYNIGNSKLKLNRTLLIIYCSTIILPMIIYIIIIQNLTTVLHFIPQYRTEDQAYFGYVEDFCKFILMLIIVTLFGLLHFIIRLISMKIKKPTIA